MTVELSVAERLVLLNDILPGMKASFGQLKALGHLKRDLMFEPEEQERIGLKQEGASFSWQTGGLEVVQFDVPEPAAAAIAKRLQVMDDACELEDRHISLCEKFLAAEVIPAE